MQVPVSVLVDEVENLGGSLVLLVDSEGERIRLDLPGGAEWLAGELKLRKLEVVYELKRRHSLLGNKYQENQRTK